MLKTSITFLLILFLFILLYSCKTSESTQSEAMNEQTHTELLQSSIDTTVVSNSPEELQRIMFMAQEAAQLFCNLKQFEGKDMNDITIAKAYDKIYNEYRKIQFEVDKLDSMGKMEYDRIFEESKTKCD